MEARLGLVGLVVRDVARSVAFYRALGMTIPPGADRVTLPGGLEFFWDSAAFVRDLDPAYSPPSGSRRVVLEFSFETPDALDAKYAQLIALGYVGHLSPFDTAWGPRYAIIRDPDDNEIGLRYAPQK